MIFTLLDFQINTASRIYYIDLVSMATEDGDMADGLFSLFHLAFVDGDWYFDLFWLKNLLKRWVMKFFS